MSSRIHVLIVTLVAATSACAGSPDATLAVRDLKIDASTRLDAARPLSNIGARTIEVAPAAVFPVSPMISSVTRIGPPPAVMPVVEPGAARPTMPELVKPIAAPVRYDGAISAQLGALVAREPVKDLAPAKDVVAKDVVATTRPLTVPAADAPVPPRADAPGGSPVDTNPFLTGAAGDGPFAPPEVGDGVDAVVNNAHLAEAATVSMQNGQVFLMGDRRSLTQANRAFDEIDEESMQAEMVLDDEDADLQSEGSTPHR